MSIESTVDVTCSKAISRIREIVELLNARDYRGLQEMTAGRVSQEVVDSWKPMDLRTIERWTNGMLAAILDR